MYIHVLKNENSNFGYPSWMDFQKLESDPLHRFHDEMVHQWTDLINTISPEITNLGLAEVDMRYPQVLYVMYDVPGISGSFIGNGVNIIRYVNDTDFFSPIPSRIVHTETITLDMVEPTLFSVCCINSASGEFFAIGHSGIYRYDLSGHILDRDIYNQETFSEDLDITDGIATLSYFPASGTIRLYDKYDISHTPMLDYIQSGTFLYLPPSGSFMVDYDRIIYEDDAKLVTSRPVWDGYHDDSKIFMGVPIAANSVTIPFELDTSDGVLLITHPTHIRPGKVAQIQFGHNWHSLVSWPDPHIDYVIPSLSGEILLSDSVRVFSDSDNGSTPLYMRGTNVFGNYVPGSTPIYPDDIELRDGNVVRSGDYDSGNFYISYFCTYRETYEVEGEASYTSCQILDAPPYPNHFEIVDGILWPRTVFPIVESRAHIYEQMLHSPRENFSINFIEEYGGLTKRQSGDLWVASQQLNLYQNRRNGQELYITSSWFEEDVTYMFADGQVDQTWSRCYLSGQHFLTDPGGGVVQYYKSIPIANMYCDPFRMIGLLNADNYILVILYKDSTIDMVYYNPSIPITVDTPDVIEVQHALTDPKDSFLFDGKLYILDEDRLEVFRLYFDYVINHNGIYYFREKYGTPTTDVPIVTIPPRPLWNMMIAAFQQGAKPTTEYSGCTDTFLWKLEPNTQHDNGGIDYLDLRAMSANDKANTIIRFDISSIPSNAVVISATLTLAQWGNFNAPFIVGAYPLKRNWVETQATWNAFSTGNAWEIPGGTGAADKGSKESSAIVPSVGNVIFSIPIMVQGWIDGTLTNYGVILIPDSYNNKYWRGWDSEECDTDRLGADPSWARPKLTITYRMPAPRPPFGYL